MYPNQLLKQIQNFWQIKNKQDPLDTNQKSQLVSGDQDGNTLKRQTDTQLRIGNLQNGTSKNIITADQDASIKQLSKVIQNNKIEEIKVEEPQYSPQLTKSLITIQASYRRKIIQKAYLIQRKRFRYRRFVIEEFLHTEENYVKDLTTLVEELLIPIKKLNVLQNEQIVTVFSNLQQIQQLNESVMLALKQKLDTFFPYQVVFDCLLQFLPFFKIYYTYCGDFNKAVKERSLLLLSNVEYSNFVQKLLKNPIMRSMSLEDFFVKPVQRLSKYVLLLGDLLKHTDQDHPDYQNISKALKEYQIINEENNKKMDDYLRSLKMTELQHQFGDNHLQLVQPNRTFIMEESISLYKKGHEPQTVICYYLTDLILITERTFNLLPISLNLKKNESTYKVYKVIYLNEIGQCKNIPDSKYYQNMFKVVGKNDVEIFIAKDSESRDKTVKTVQQIVHTLRVKKSEQYGNQSNLSLSQIVREKVPKVHVNVIGTEEYNAASLIIRMKQFRQKLFLRFSQIIELNDLVSRAFPKVQLSSLSNIQWFKNHQAQLLEQRKIEIENFLQIVLDNPQIQDNPGQILQQLGLPLNFYMLYKIVEEDRQRQSTQSMNEQKLQNLVEDQDNKPINMQLEQKFMQKLYQAQVITNSMKDQDKKEKIQITLMDDSTLILELDWQVKAIQVCEIIAQQLELQQFYDFKLFVADNQSNLRIIEDDQLLLISLPKNESKIWLEKKSFWKKFFVFIENYSLVFRKYIHLPTFIEEIEFKQDVVRLRLLVNQSLKDIRLKHYILTDSEYCQFAALYIYMTSGGESAEYFNEKEKFPFKDIQSFFGNQLFKQRTKEQWKKTILTILDKIDKNIILISQMNSGSIQIDSQINQSQFVKKTELAYMVFMNNLNSQVLFGQTIFYVFTSNKTKKSFEHLHLPINVFIGINYNTFNIIAPSRKSIIQKILFKEIQDSHAFPKSFVFKYDNKFMKFKTTQSYQIYQLIKEYNELTNYIKQ